MSGKRVVKRPQKLQGSEDGELQLTNRKAPFVRVRFDDDGEEEVFGSALLSEEVLRPEDDEPIKFCDLTVGQKVVALWKRIHHYNALVIEIYKGEEAATDEVAHVLVPVAGEHPHQPVKGKEIKLGKENKMEKSKKNKQNDVSDKQTKLKPGGKRQKRQKDADDSPNNVQKKKKEIQEQAKQRKVAQAASAQEAAAQLFQTNSSACSLKKHVSACTTAAILPSSAHASVVLSPSAQASVVFSASAQTSIALPTSAQSSVVLSTSVQSSVLPTSTQASVVLSTSAQSSVLPTSTQASVVLSTSAQSPVVPTSTQASVVLSTTAQSSVLPTSSQSSVVLSTSSQSSVWPMSTQNSVGLSTSAQTSGLIRPNFPASPLTQSSVWPTSTQSSAWPMSTQTSVFPTSTQASVVVSTSAQSSVWPTSTASSVWPMSAQTSIWPMSTQTSGLIRHNFLASPLTQSSIIQPGMQQPHLYNSSGMQPYQGSGTCMSPLMYPSTPYIANTGYMHALHQNLQPHDVPGNHDPLDSTCFLDISENTGPFHPPISSTPSKLISSSLHLIDDSVIDSEIIDPVGMSPTRSYSPPYLPSATTNSMTTNNNMCVDCLRKDKEISDLKQRVTDLELSRDTGKDPAISTEPEKKKQYHPKTRPGIKFADYMTIGDGQPIPDGYHLLAPGAQIAVKDLWLHDVLSSISKARRKKEKKAKKKGKEMAEDRSPEVLKRLMDGFYDPWDLRKKGGTTVFAGDPVYESLKLYSSHTLKMDAPSFTRAWNTKMGAARVSMKRLESV